MTTSIRRPTISSAPFRSKRPRSPVCSQPSASIVRRVASASVYPIFITFGPTRNDFPYAPIIRTRDLDLHAGHREARHPARCESPAATP